MYELMPFDPNIGSLDAVIRLVQDAGAPTGGIVLDFWHLGKLGVAAADLRHIPRDIPLYVELGDGELENMPDPVEETTQFRKLPGDGEFDVRGYVAALRELGYDGPWGVEVLSRWLRSLPMPEMFERTVATASAQFAPEEISR
jgi:sugar phosphate isomerase/epimerase